MKKKLLSLLANELIKNLHRAKEEIREVLVEEAIEEKKDLVGGVYEEIKVFDRIEEVIKVLDKFRAF